MSSLLSESIDNALSAVTGRSSPSWSSADSRGFTLAGDLTVSLGADPPIRREPTRSSVASVALLASASFLSLLSAASSLHLWIVRLQSRSTLGYSPLNFMDTILPISTIAAVGSLPA